MGASFSSSNSNRRRHRNGQSGFSDINVTPFVDVMLVLLVIFMVTAPLLVTTIEVDLPDAKGEPTSDTKDPIEITIDKTGDIYIQDKPIERDDIAATLQAISKEVTLPILIRGDRVVDYENVIKVLSEVNRAGYINIGLVTKR